uniref:S-adenosylmethionine-dependent methyltransferase n=1 Tax=Kalanchoe fedtschenkoi TaxID=63787 RepID=A0A7N0VE32_KALFE
MVESAGAEAFPMQGGDGTSSYAKNSAYQKWVVDGAKPMILDAIAKHLDVGSGPSKIVIADLGCSTGPNTFFSVENIIGALELKYEHGLEFQVLFNDHVANDFNTLFKTIPRAARYYAAGVPGSFHGRLFPESSVHVAHSSYSLHWLSRAPLEISDPNSPAWNKGRILWPGKEEEVIKSYLSQYTKDMESFLSARAKEVFSGGLVMISFNVRPNGALHTSQSALYNLIGACLMDMA